MERSTRSMSKSVLNLEEMDSLSRSSSYHECLLCWSPCGGSDGEGDLEGFRHYPEIAGAEGSVQLRKELSHWFILRKLLDVPRHWVENGMMGGFKGQAKAGIIGGDEKTDFEEEGDADGINSWFQVCGVCLTTVVTQAWCVHEQILKLEGRMKKIKAEVRGKIREGQTGSCNGDSKRSRERDHVAMEIRKLVVPDIEQLLEKRNKDQVQPKEEIMEQDSLLLDADEAISPEFDVTSIIDDDPNDINWSPHEEDSKVVIHLNNDNENQIDNPSPASPPLQQPVVKKMRVRGKDKKKRKKKTILKGIKPRPCNKTERAPRPPRVRVHPKKVKVKIKQEPTDTNPSNDPQAIAQIKKVRGKDKTRRKSKPPRVRPKKTIHICSSCDCVPFPTSEELEIHKKLHQERRLLKQRIEKGEEFTGEKLDCDQCTFPARDSLELALHFRYRHGISSWGHAKTKHHTCPLCPKLMPWGDILIHLRSKHATPEEEEEVTAFKDRCLKCDQCDFRGTLPKHLILHKRRTHPQKEEEAPVREEDCLSCNECGVICTSAMELQCHVDSKHNRLQRFVCVECGAGFPYQVRLDHHMITHTKHLKRDWVCHVCGVDFPRKGQLVNHCEKYHPEGEKMKSKGSGTQEEKIYKCRYCELTSPYNAVIRKHLETHKQQGDHRCEKCGRCYMNAQGLKRHLRINHSESGEQVLCPHCLRGFPSREYMMIHIKRYCKLKDLPGKGETQEDVPTSSKS